MIIFLNGSLNSGKSTVSKEIVKLLPNTAHIEVDHLREFIDWMPLDKSISINLKNATSVINNFVDEGLNVVVSYPLSQRNFDYISGLLEPPKTEIFIFMLKPPFDKLIVNRGKRMLEQDEIERIKYHYNENRLKVEGQIELDNSSETPKKTALRILEAIR